MSNNIINKVLYISFILISISCLGKNTKQERTDINTSLVTDKDKTGERIGGNFDGKSPNGYAYIVKTKEGEGNPIDDDNATADEYTVLFSNKEIASLPIGCCDAILIFEGDLNEDGADEFSIFQAPMNGCTYYWQTFTYKNDKWEELFDGYLIPTGCENLPNEEELLNMVAKEGNAIYYYEQDPNEGNLLKKKATLK